MNIRRFLVFTAFFLPFVLMGEMTAGEPGYKTATGYLDQFYVQLYTVADEKKLDEIIVRTDNTTYVNVYNSKKGDAPDQAAQNENLMTRKYLTNSDPANLSRISLPYGANYYIDIPLFMERMKAGVVYEFRLSNISLQKAVKVIQIINNVTGEVSGNLLDEGSSFSFSFLSEKKEYEFTLRAFGAEPFIENSAIDTDANLWSNPSNWLSGKLPGGDSHVIIPEGTQVIIEAGKDYKIGYLTNRGTLVNNGTLEVSDFMEVLTK